MPIARLVFVAILMGGCGSREVPEPTNDGDYVVFSGDSDVRLVVIQDGNRLSSDGTYENETGISPRVGQLVPSSVSAAFKISTKTCGEYEFVLSKGNSMLCTNCNGVSSLHGYNNCSFEGRRMPMLWKAVGL
ncbi:hypothetical protein D3C81_1128210 [compost metagenome]